MEILERYTLFDSVLPTTTGIYRIVNLLNGKQYIGSARANGNVPSKKGFRSRFNNGPKSHRQMLKNNNHHSPYLQNSYDFYIREGYDINNVFEIQILEFLPRERCIEREQWHFDTYKPEYNVILLAGGGWDGQHTPEECAKISARNRERKRSPESIAKQSASMKGRKPSAETIAKSVASRTGKKATAQHKANSLAAREKLLPLIVAISPEGKVFIFKNVTRFCQDNPEYKLNNSGVSKCFKDPNAKYKGWRFLYHSDWKDSA